MSKIAPFVARSLQLRCGTTRDTGDAKAPPSAPTNTETIEPSASSPMDGTPKTASTSPVASAVTVEIPTSVLTCAFSWVKVTMPDGFFEAMTTPYSSMNRRLIVMVGG